MMSTGIQETEDVIEFLGVLGEKFAGNKAIVTAFKEKNWAALGVHLAALATDVELRDSGIKAFDGIKTVTDELKDLSILEGLQLGQDSLR